MTVRRLIQDRVTGYLCAVLAIGAVTAVYAPLRGRIHDATVALTLVLVVLFMATLWGRGPGVLAAVLGVFSYNYFLLPATYGIYSFTIADPHNWIALAAFIITASTVGHLSVAEKRREAETRRLARLQAAVAELGQRALLDGNVWDEAVAAVARALDVEYCGVLELLPDGEGLILRWGVGWKEGLVGRATVPSGAGSQAGLALLSDEPVIIEDLRAAGPVHGAQLFHDHGVVSGMSVVISTREGPYGVLAAHTKQRRKFTNDEINFLRSVAHVLGATIEHRQAEEALRASEANLNRAQEVAHIGSWHLDITRNRLTWSDEVFRIFGIPPGTPLAYEDFLRMVHPEDRESVDRAWTAAMRGAAYDIEHRILCNGQLKWVRERAKVEFDESGNPVEGIGTVQDITELKQAEEAIRTLLREQAAAAELKAAREREIEIGHRIQQMLLLDQPPADVPGLRMAAVTIPSQRIDGDFYLFIRHPDDRLDVVVGDVMGKGIPAALLSAATKSHFIKALAHLTALSRNGGLPEPKEIVTVAHAELVRHLIELENFVTLCYARLDLNKRRLDLVDCGHTGLIHWHAATGICETVHGNNLPLGIREGETYDQIGVPFETGDLLLFYSDGVTETRNLAGELFGIDRLLQCVTMHGGLEPEALLETIRRATSAFSQPGQPADDLTCVAIRIEEAQTALARAALEIRSDFKELRRARGFVRDFCYGCPGSPLGEDEIAALELAVNEAACNIMKHAYHGRTGERIDLEAEAFPSRVSVRLRHLGDPFDPSAVSPPALNGSQESGFGIYLITHSVDEVRYYRDERGRHCIALTKGRAS
ncbi:MAG TPA: SpoIIE family protein phosphatase [candidate division Zixibacteria bacterium]|nr:SpoIIE family protein phosphatase [candidate division Zixibacteria bacterium]